MKRKPMQMSKPEKKKKTHTHSNKKTTETFVSFLIKRLDTEITIVELKTRNETRKKKHCHAQGFSVTFEDI